MSGDGFSNYLVTKTGSLVRTFIQSPNFVHLVSGWQIAKNGSAEFNNVLIRGAAFIGTILSLLGYQVIAPSGDVTGAKDYANINGALSGGSSVLLTQGTFYLPVPVAWANASLTGVGDDTTIVPAAGFTGTAILQPGSNSQVLNLAGYGGSSVRSANPAAHFIQVQTGATFWRCTEIRCQYVNGLIISCDPATGSHGTVRNIRGEHCNGGVAINHGAGAAVVAEVNISDMDVQNCEVNEVLLLQAVTDVLCVGPVNGSVLGGVAANCVTVSGPCETCLLLGLDVGGGAGAGVLVFQATAGGSPAEIEIGPGTVQQGNVGVVVGGASTRLYFHGLWAKANQTDGWQLNNTGSGCEMTGCGGNTNNASAGTGYDVNDTTTGHWLNNGFRYVSGAVTAGRFLAAGNHYTEANAPASMTTAGAAPGGW